MASVVRGSRAYYAVPGNRAAVATFRTQVTRLWHVALERRSQRTRISWKRMDRLAHDGSHLPVSCIPFPTCDSAFVPKAGAQCVSSRDANFSAFD